MGEVRLPATALGEVRGRGPPYSAHLQVTLWPGLKAEVRLSGLSRCPDRALCSRLERGNSWASYVVTLYSQGEPFASVYVFPPWLRRA
ncbi:MAG: hypothetical protein RXO24_10095 [Acidilobus sp.]